ncbi:MAG TPA: hypothetical protein VF877_01795 [Gaiellaceae bacterium]
MDETYRMLGREHQADLEREALKWQRAAEVRGRRRAPATPDIVQQLKGVQLVVARFAAFVGRAARAEA